jgi:aspartyl protease family protein
MWAVVIIGIAIAIAIIAAITGSESIMGVDLNTAMPMIGGVLIASALAVGAISNYRGQMGEAMKAVVGWLAITLVIVAGYTYRFELAGVGNRIAGSVVPGLTLFGSGGEVTVSRSADGHFQFTMLANGQSMRVMLDTGASSVVLRAEDAALMGIKLQESDYSVSVRTANGRTQSAPVTLKTLEIGGIREENVRALVAKPGLLGENLLGMTFLERLSSYEVRGDQLILRGKGS